MKKSAYFIVSIFVLFCIFVSPALLHARTTWFVDDDAPADPGPGDPAVSDPLEDGSASHPFDAIQEGIDAAFSGDTVLVLDGTYTGDGNRDLDFNGRAITVRSENGAESCIIDCQASSPDPHRGFYFHSGENLDSVVDGFTIQNGYAGGSTPEERSGGAIHCYASSPSIINNTINANRSAGGNSTGGGGLFCYDSFSIISNNIFSSNIVHIDWSNGGGIFCVDSYPIISQNTLSGNSVHYGHGGGIRCSGGYASITDCTITGNSVGEGVGGGISCESATISHCTVTGNWAGYWSGGGIGLVSGEITNCTISNNQTGVQGGGISCGSPAIRNCLISNNSAWLISWNEGKGGGISCLSAAITDCTIIDNSVFTSGGGISGASPSITNCTISNNSAIQAGGGISCNGSPTIENNTITGNTASGGTSPSLSLGNGGGIHLDSCTSALIKNNRIQENLSGWSDTNPFGGNGGGMALISCSASLLINNRIILNTALNGGGIYCYDSSPDIVNNLLSENIADLSPPSFPARLHGGGGIYCRNHSAPAITNCTLADNEAITAEGGGAIYCDNSLPEITNSILWGNAPNEIHSYSEGPTIPVQIFYSDVQGGYPGVENIDTDPFFAAGPMGNYYLSQFAAGQASESPCVDTGNTLIGLLPEGRFLPAGMSTRTDHRMDSGIIDMGFHYPTACVADAGGPYSGKTDQAIAFDASSSEDPYGSIVAYRWDWTNDGSWDTGWLSQPVTEHTYNNEFHGQVRLQIKDDDDYSGTDLADVDVNPPAIRAARWMEEAR